MNEYPRLTETGTNWRKSGRVYCVIRHTGDAHDNHQTIAVGTRRIRPGSVTCRKCPRSSITGKVITPGENWVVRGRGRTTKTSDRLVLMLVVRGEREREGWSENPAPAEVDGKRLGGRSVIVIPYHM